MRYWTVKEINFIKDNLDNYSDKYFASMYSVTVKAFSSMRTRHNIIRPKYQYSFRKGRRPWNKGICFNAGGRSIETRFKKKVA